MQNLCMVATWFFLELRDAEALFNSDEKVLDPKTSREIPKPDFITKTKNGRTFEFKDVSDLDPEMSNIEKLISEGLKDDMVKLSDQFEGKAQFNFFTGLNKILFDLNLFGISHWNFKAGQDVDMKMKVKVVKNMDDLENILKEAQTEIENLMKKKKASEEEEDLVKEEDESSLDGDEQKDTTLKYEK